MRSCATQEIAAALLGGNTIPKPRLMTIVGHIIAHMPTWRLKRDEYQHPIATRINPSAMNLRVSTPNLATRRGSGSGRKSASSVRGLRKVRQLNLG